MEKEKKSKKIAAIVAMAALIVIIVLCLVCCQSGGSDGDPTGNTTGATTAATTEGAGNGEPGTEVTEPSETPTETTQPTTESTTPPTEATQPSTEGNNPTDPKETEPKPTEGSKPTTGTTNPQHSHSYSSAVTAPTCTANGYTTYRCSCGNSYKDNYTSKVAHSYSDWYTAVEPTTATTGLSERKCSICGTKETKILDKLTVECTHNYECTVFGPTCIRVGYDYYRCTLCGDRYTEDWEEDVLADHSYSLVSSVAGDCSTGKDGSETYKCSVCDDTYTKTISGGHNWVHHHTDEVGHEVGYYACHCGGFEFACELAMANPEMFLEAYNAHVNQAKAETGTTAGHSYYSYGKWVIDTPASDKWVCSVCGKETTTQP